MSELLERARLYIERANEGTPFSANFSPAILIVDLANALATADRISDHHKTRADLMRECIEKNGWETEAWGQDIFEFILFKLEWAFGEWKAAEKREAELREAVEKKCKALDFEAQELLLTQNDEDLKRASAYHYAIDKIREVNESQPQQKGG